MPELPEVETMRRGIASIAGSTIREVTRVKCRLKPIKIQPRIDALRRRCVGQKVLEVGRLGKRVTLRLEDGHRIIVEPRMTGLILINNPPDVEHLRFRMSFADGPIPEFLYWDRRGLGSIRLLSQQQLHEQLGSPRLGPDALEVSAPQLRLQFHRSRQAIKVALLDQQRVAGIGNLYASEILHAAGLHPGKRCHRLTREQWNDLHSAIVRVLSEAVFYEGSTLSDGTYRNALNTPGQYQNHHRVYQRAGQTCPSCHDGVIRRFVQAQRSTFFCPQCQARRPR